jgi:hypothetical protein
MKIKLKNEMCQGAIIDAELDAKLTCCASYS